ncbi:DUF924 domain-containing protein [Shewanella psychropiezotolerans]|uniref:DUF924 domain-containing protein n=1 Tax=Shewanella psychropiezotolerans TaxID=2593655 RepID=A0ABX5X102_9GAMM|nr:MULTISPECIES: DUF924 family protein [Shewanella]MPY21585.1 DUF924 domain-containing protein [Shewanella sp. YLB-07]QDO84811.1 DUF924 domain-containing protein [Shewanella psychropiezotolerans]
MNNFLNQWFDIYDKGNGVELESLTNDVKLQWFDLLQLAKAEKLNAWNKCPPGRLSLILLFGPVAYLLKDNDKALHEEAKLLCIEGIRKGFDSQLKLVQRRCFYDPLFYSSKAEDHRLLLLLLKGMESQASEDEKKAWFTWFTQASSIG